MASSSFPTASSSYPAERAHEAPPPWDPERDRDEAVLQQIQGLLRRGSPDPDVSWRAVWKRLLAFVIVMALLMFGGTLFGG